MDFVSVNAGIRYRLGITTDVVHENLWIYVVKVTICILDAIGCDFFFPHYLVCFPRLHLYFYHAAASEFDTGELCFDDCEGTGWHAMDVIYYLYHKEETFFL